MQNSATAFRNISFDFVRISGARYCLHHIASRLNISMIHEIRQIKFEFQAKHLHRMKIRKKKVQTFCMSIFFYLFENVVRLKKKRSAVELLFRHSMSCDMLMLATLLGIVIVYTVHTIL